MKKLIKNNLIGFIIGGLIFGSVVYAVGYKASDISYTRDGVETTVDESLDELYNILKSDDGAIIFKERKEQYVGTCTFDIKNYTSEYVDLTNDSFYVGISNTVSDSGTYGLNVSHSYDSTTGILTVRVNDGVNNNVDRPTFLVVIKK